MSLRFKELTAGKRAGIILEKLFVNSIVRPLYREALIFIIVCTPFALRCYLLDIKFTIYLNNNKLVL
jgi:hypothetical protein